MEERGATNRRNTYDRGRVSVLVAGQSFSQTYCSAFTADNVKFAIIVTPTQRESFLHKILPDRISRIIAEEDHNNDSGSRRTIDYLPDFNRYSDRVEEENSEGDIENGARKTVKSGTEQVEGLFAGRSDDAGQERGPLENEWLRSSN